MNGGTESLGSGPTSDVSIAEKILRDKDNADVLKAGIILPRRAAPEVARDTCYGINATLQLSSSFRFHGNTLRLLADVPSD